MTEHIKIDWRTAYLEMARVARSEAETSPNPALQQTWKFTAEIWEQLSLLRDEICFCGRAAIGIKSYERNECVPYCSRHLAEAITKDVLSRIAASRKR